MNYYNKIGVFGLALSLFCMIQSTYADPPLPTPVGRVVWIKGTSLKALMPNKEQRLLQKLSVIYLHDILSTDNKTEAEIVFTDNTLMTFRPNTQFSIDQYSFKPKPKTKHGSVGKYIMSLIEGGFRTITGLIAKSNPPDYQVNTPVATIGVRGTDYAVYVKQGQVYVGYYTGKPCVKSKKQGGELCLDNNTPYAFVPTSEVPPQALTQQPDVFKEKLEITPAKIAGFGTGTGGPHGPISSFCISQ
jgi:hypothetical protein